MAINKRATPTWVKVVIIVVALSFIALPVISAIGSASFGGGSSNKAATAADGYATIAQKYAGQTQALDAQLASEPTSYTVLVNQGNAYFDWASEVQKDKTLATSGADRPLWLAATGYYERAVAEKAGDPPVGVDLAISYFYAGQTDKAIDAVSKVMKKSPNFAPAAFNAGVFYEAAGKNAEAVSAYETYLKLDPSGAQGQPQVAKDAITKLKGASTTK